MAIQEAIERLAGNQSTQLPASTLVPPIVEPIVNETIQGNTPVNGDNSWTAKWPTTQPEETSHYFTKAETEAMFKQERDQATTALNILNLKPPYPEKMVEKEFPTDYKVQKFQNLMAEKETQKSMLLISSTLWENMQEINSSSFKSSPSHWRIEFKPSTSVSNYERSKIGNIWSSPSILSSSMQKRSTL